MCSCINRMCIKHLLHAPDIGGGPGPGHCAGNLTYMMQVNLLKALGIGYLMFIFFQEDLDAGRATLGVNSLLSSSSSVTLKVMLDVMAYTERADWE